MEDEKTIARARHRVAALKGFYIHLAVFALVICILLAVNLVTASSWWVQWPFLGWGIGVLAHAFAVFGRAPAAVDRWEAKKMAELSGGRSPPNTPVPSATKASETGPSEYDLIDPKAL